MDQEKEIKGNFELDKLASLPNFYMPSLNHKKDTLAFYWDKTGRLEMYTMDLGTKEIIQISNGEVPRDLKSGFVWSRNDEEIIFCKDDSGAEKNNIYSLHLTTKELKVLSDTPDHQEYISDSSPDGKWLTFLSNRAGQLNLFRMKNDGSDVQQITAHENPVFDGGNFSPNGENIAYICNEEGDLKNMDIYLAKPDGTFVERVVQTKVGSQDGFSNWSKDGKSFAFTTDVNGTSQAAIFNIETKKIKYFGDNTQEEYAIDFTEDNKSLVCLGNKDSSICPLLYNIENGEKTILNFPPGIAVGSEITNDNKLILTLNRPTSPSSLVIYDLKTDNSEILLETDTGDIDQKLFIDAEQIWYPSLDGTKIPGIVYKPRDFDPNKKYPTIVSPHGGPTGQYFMYFDVFSQYFADLGYIILLPNVRGSTGYGVEFRDSCIKDWGGKDHDDWVAGRQWLIDNASADPQRIGVFGGSYGGYATLVCMTKSPELWNAGCAWVPISHLGNMYEKSMDHYKYFLRWQMGDPVKDKDLWEERSPLNYAQNVKNPLMLLHGTTDPRCPVSESRNFIDKLTELGKIKGKDGDFEYVEWEDEGHGMYSDIEHRIRAIKAVVGFFDRRL